VRSAEPTQHPLGPQPEGVSFVAELSKKPSGPDPQQRSVATLPQPLPAFHNTGTQLSLSRGGDRCALSGCRVWLLPAPSRGLAHQARSNVRPGGADSLGTPATQSSNCVQCLLARMICLAMALREDIVV